MPYGFGGGPWWINQGNGSNYNSRPFFNRRCFQHPWLSRWWWASQYPATQASDKEQETTFLKTEAEDLKNQLSQVEKRLEELENKSKED